MKDIILIGRNNQDNPLVKDGEPLAWFPNYLKIAAARVLFDLPESKIKQIFANFISELLKFDQRGEDKIVVPFEDYRRCLSNVMSDYPEILNAWMPAHTEGNAKLFDGICLEAYEISQGGQKTSGTVDIGLASSQRAAIVAATEKTIYQNFHLSEEQKAAYEQGFIYVHDMGHRRDEINCCLFDMEAVLSGGFEMGDIWFDEPQSLKEAFDAIIAVSLNAAAQIYGGFTISQIDELLVPFARKSLESAIQSLKEKGVDKSTALLIAKERIQKDFDYGFRSLEERLNSSIPPGGDYPFITITFGLGRDCLAQMATLAALKVRERGHGKDGFKHPALFPKLVFLFDESLHTKGKELHRLFQAALECSSKVMYPEYLSLTGSFGNVSRVYREYGQVISPMCCRTFLSNWFERGGESPADPSDTPVFVGRFNFGVVSLNLPMILQESREQGCEFYATLDHYLEMVREIHQDTYRFLARKKAKTNPLAFMQGGLYGGNLGREDFIESLLESATASFGITALNELQRLFNGKSLVEDGAFALETMRHINEKVSQFKAEDKIQYVVYGTPAENLCGRQAKQFREEFGIVKNVSDRSYFSNSFHCHVSENITPIEKQDLEARFWELFEGGKIQYVRIPAPYNIEALEVIVLHAMDLGLYEGINISKAYCNTCGYEWANSGMDRPDSCPECASEEITMIERMCGYLAYTKIHGDSRLNDPKMDEIKDRISM